MALLAGSSVAEAQRVIAAKDVPPGHRPPRGMCRVWIDGVPPGRQPAVTDCLTARARAPLNSRIIYGDLTPFPGQGKNRAARDCRYEERRSTLGDIIFGRRASDRDYECRYDDRRQFGSWYEIGRDGRGVPIYQRLVRSRDGTVMVQRGYPARNGSIVLLDTRYARPGIDLFRGDDDWRWFNAGPQRPNSARRTMQAGNKRELKTLATRSRASGNRLAPNRSARGKATAAEGKAKTAKGKAKAQLATGKGKGKNR